MICSDRVDLLDFFAEGCHFVDDELQEIMRSRATGKVSELSVKRARPRADDGNSNLERG